MAHAKAKGIMEIKEGAPDGNLADQGTAELKKQVGDFMTAFTEFKSANDDQLKLLKKGQEADPLIEEKMSKINRAMDQFEGFSAKLVKLEGVADELKKLDDRFDKIDTMLQRGGQKQTGELLDQKMRIDDWARGVIQSTRPGQKGLNEHQLEVMAAIEGEYKALNVSTATEGGYLAPIEFVRDIIKDVIEMSPVRTLARVRQTGMRSVQIPKRTGTFAARWTGAEQSPKSETEGLNWGLHEINTHELYALIDITQLMMEDGMFDMQAEIQTEASEQFALAEGTAFVLGTGIEQPEGFMVNTSIVTTNSGSAATIADSTGQANGMLEMKYTLKTDYASNARWLMNRTTLGAVRRLKDGNNNYIWTPGIALGRPNTIDGDPYVEMSDMPNQGAGATPIAYGDFRRGYTWIDRLVMEMLVDPYTQATGGKIRHILRKRVAGKVTQPEAIKKLVCAA